MFKYLERHKEYLVYIPLTMYWVTLFIFTSIPSSRVPNVGVNDKTEHSTAFFILGCLLNLMLYYQDASPFLKKHYNWATIFFGFLYGALDELHQKFVPGRSCDIFDWISDASGILIAVYVVFLLRKMDLRRNMTKTQ